MSLSRTQLEPLRAKSGFSVPDEYLTLYEEGRLRYGESREDWKQNANVICLSAPPALICNPYYWCVEWYSAIEMLEWTPPDYWKPLPLVAFAGSGYGDDWCWLPDRTGRLGTPVAFCRHDENDSEIYAPNFAGFLYRSLLESFAYIPKDSLSDYEGGPPMYRRFLCLCAEPLVRFLPEAWAATTYELLDRPFRIFDATDPETYGLLARTELDERLGNDALMAGINEHFEHMSA